MQNPSEIHRLSIGYPILMSVSTKWYDNDSIWKSYQLQVKLVRFTQYGFFPRRLIENQWFKIYAFNQKIPWNPFETKQFEFRGNSNFLVIVSLKLGAFGPNWKLIWEDGPFRGYF